VWNRREDRADFRVARMEALTAEINRNPEKRPKPFSPSDFFTPRCAPEPAPEKEEVPEWKNQLAMVEMLNAAFGGKDLRGETQEPHEDHG
jgi:hypothetical protein